MPQNEATSIDPLAGGSFSRLLFSDVELDDAVNLVGLDNTHAGSDSRFTFSSDQKTPKMLCFGADYINGVSTVSTTTNDNNNSSSPSSTTTTTTSLSSNSNMKRNMGSDYYQPVSFNTTGATMAPVTTTRRNNKKMRAENTPPASHAKVKEKLGERIAALQQMVSPYGKTDTASVLHEAMGYIKFLQEQVQVLCSPYLKRLSTTHIDGQEDGGGERKKDLRSRGLCLVPVECTLHVAESNGADLWSPAHAMVNRQGSSGLH